MSLFKKKCAYCEGKIDKDKEISKEVGTPGWVGIKKKAFCCKEHVERYEAEMEEYKNKSKTGGCCCG